MQIRIRFYILTLLIGSTFWQCSETKEIFPEDLGTNYFPLKSGDYRIYDVSGVRYNSSVDSVVFSYLLKESVTDTFTNLESGISYKILREKKYSEEGLWEIDSLWTARKDDRAAVSVENNVPIIKLSFPVSDSLTWDSNRLNDKFSEEYTLVNLSLPFVGEYETYDNTSTVIQYYLPDLVVNWISRKEIYAEHVGLVYKENVKIEFRTETEFLNLGVIRSGLKYYQHLVEYGEE